MAGQFDPRRAAALAAALKAAPAQPPPMPHMEGGHPEPDGDEGFATAPQPMSAAPAPKGFVRPPPGPGIRRHPMSLTPPRVPGY